MELKQRRRHRRWRRPRRRGWRRRRRRGRRVIRSKRWPKINLSGLVTKYVNLRRVNFSSAELTSSICLEGIFARVVNWRHVWSLRHVINCFTNLPSMLKKKIVNVLFQKRSRSQIKAQSVTGAQFLEMAKYYLARTPAPPRTQTSGIKLLVTSQ